jgi:hypothetical protein
MNRRISGSIHFDSDYTFNFANFDLPTSIMSGLLTGTAGTINGTNPAAHNTNRVGVGTGIFALGAPREIEFSLKIAF